MTSGGATGAAAFLVVLVLCATTPAAAAAAAAQEPASTVWLVRHAERADAGAASAPDPELSAVGAERAAGLARLLGDAGITSIHSTDYHRTRQTAAPLARALDIEVQLYDPRDAASMARLEAAVRAPGRHLVVGHSNTTPAFVTRLGGEAGAAMPESEYDRLYLLRLARDHVETTVLRFGRPAPGGGER